MLCAATGIPDKKPVGKFPVYQLSICLFMQFVQKPDSFICHLVSRPFNGCHRRAETFPVKIPVKPCDWYLSLERRSFYGLQKAAAIRSFALITACGSSSPASYAAIIFLAYVSPERYS